MRNKGSSKTVVPFERRSPYQRLGVFTSAADVRIFLDIGAPLPALAFPVRLRLRVGMKNVDMRFHNTRLLQPGQTACWVDSRESASRMDTPGDRKSTRLNSSH